IARSATFFERVKLSITSLPAGWSGKLTPSSVMGWTAKSASISIVVPMGTPVGSYQIGVQGTNQGRTVTVNVPVNVVVDIPTAKPPVTSLVSGIKIGRSTLKVRVSWPAATDPSSAI